MTIIRVSKVDHYSVIDNRFLSDNRLSWKAKGLLTYLLSKPNGWEVRIGDLIKQSTDGEDSVRAGLNELKDAGYINWEQRRDAAGHITGYEYTVYERPCRENPDMGKPDPEKPNILVNTDGLVNTDSIKEGNDDGGGSKNIFRLYENTFATPVPPILVDELKDYERSHNQQQLEFAFHQAAGRGARGWNYAKAILDNPVQSYKLEPKQQQQPKGSARVSVSKTLAKELYEHAR